VVARPERILPSQQCRGERTRFSFEIHPHLILRN
jgi:hypothetical protein